jgi:mersacidin/lichenicidin family type 2 lantibiotic
MHKNKIDVIRAWKDPEYRATLTEEELAALPANPAGMTELTGERLAHVTGGVVLTTAPTCTMLSWRDWKRCCP